MSYTVRVDPLVRNDLLEIHQYIALDSAQQADRWIDILEQTFNSLSEIPERVPMRDDLRKGYRVTHVGRYLIFFRIVEDKKEVQIMRVIHSARDISKAFDDQADT